MARFLLQIRFTGSSWRSLLQHSPNLLDSARLPGRRGSTLASREGQPCPFLAFSSLLSASTRGERQLARALALTA
jgi:hypothetical protein